MTDRKTIDQITSDELDQLYDQLDALRAVSRGYCPHCGRGDCAPSVTDWEQQKQRADRAEQQLARIADLADEHPAGIDTALILEALDTGPAATQATGHTYLSTGCHHGNHDYCSNVDGIAGLKKPAQCKFCAAPCVCGCHANTPAAVTP